MSQQEPFPFAPLVERCFELAVDVSAEQFEEEAAAFMAAVGAALDLSEHKTIEHWEIRIDKPKNGPPKPKATLYNVPTVSRPERSVIGNRSIESVTFIPVTASAPARLKYAQLKPEDGTIMSFFEAKKRLDEVLSFLEARFSNKSVLQVSLNYTNDLRRFDGPYFNSESIFHLSRVVGFLSHNLGNLTSPLNVFFGWESPTHVGDRIHLEIKSEAARIQQGAFRNQLWAVLTYQGKLLEEATSWSDRGQQLDAAHKAIYEKFLSILTPEALQYCQNGSVNDPTPQP